MFGANNEKKSQEERIKKLMLYVKHDLIKSPYIDKYTEDEINEAKRRVQIEKRLQPTPSITDSICKLM